jgi:hypothetical protein
MIEPRNMNTINKNFIQDFLIFCGHDLKNLSNIDKTIDDFLIRLEKGVFEISLKMGKLEYKQRLLMKFCNFAFHANFISYRLDYYPKIYPYVCKETYSKKLKQLKDE